MNCKDITLDENGKVLGLIKSYAIVKYGNCIDSLPKEAYYSLAYAIDKDRECLILFNPSLDNIEKLNKSEKPVSVIFSKGLPPEHYKKLFEHINQQMSLNLNEMQSNGRSRWRTYPMSEHSIGICQTRYLHSINALTFELEDKSE